MKSKTFEQKVSDIFDKYHIDNILSLEALREIVITHEQDLKVKTERIAVYCEKRALAWNPDRIGTGTFRSGVSSGHLWTKDHIPHIMQNLPCKCPGTTNHIKS